MKAIRIVSITAAMTLFACGGKRSAGPTEPVGESHVADDLDVDKPDINENPGTDAGKNSAEPIAAASDAGAAKEAGTPAAKNGPPVRFQLVNTHDENLVLSLDMGWQPILSAWSGTPPNAESILMFPTFCTAQCDIAEEKRCPYCPKPKKAREEREAEKREVIAPGKTFEVTWDGKVFVYEKTRGLRDGRSKSCSCYRKEKAPAKTYTVRACGLRITKSARKRSKYQCPTAKMTLPSAEPLVIKFEFPAP